MAARLDQNQQDFEARFAALLAAKREADVDVGNAVAAIIGDCLLYTSPSPRDPKTSRMPSSA